MSESKKKIIIIIGVTVAIIAMIYMIVRESKKEFDTFFFPTTMEVSNYTKVQMVDTISMVILNKILCHDAMKIDIYTMPDVFNTPGDMELIAFIEDNPFEQHRYKIYIKEDASLDELMSALSHEMVHLQQHEDGRLQVIKGKAYIWDGDTVLYSEVPYKERPYEKEAFKQGPDIKKKLNSIIYKD